VAATADVDAVQQQRQQQQQLDSSSSSGVAAMLTPARSPQEQRNQWVREGHYEAPLVREQVR
jgi:hypothetical protein